MLGRHDVRPSPPRPQPWGVAPVVPLDQADLIYQRRTTMDSPPAPASGLLGALLAAVVLLICGPLHVQATTMGLCDVDVPGTCTSAVTLSGTSLTLTLTNTSPVANGGFLTAVAFDLAGPVQITAFS